MNLHTSHINLYDAAALGIRFTGLNFALLLGFTKKINRLANRFLALALVVMVLWMIRISGVETRLPLQFSLALVSVSVRPGANYSRCLFFITHFHTHTLCLC